MMTDLGPGVKPEYSKPCRAKIDGPLATRVYAKRRPHGTTLRFKLYRAQLRGQRHTVAPDRRYPYFAFTFAKIVSTLTSSAVIH
jgi:hypothetical protein